MQLSQQPQQPSKRRFIAGVLSLPLTLNTFAKSAPANNPRELSFYHTHTDKDLCIVYHNGKSHIAPALQEINQFLSDFRTGDVYPIDVRLLDALYLLQQKFALQTQVEKRVKTRVEKSAENSFEVISAYRSPKSNAMLRNRSHGVAKRSLHMQGKAIDIRLKGVNTKTLRDTAMAMKVGGVGYYRRSNFIHMDTGRVRFW
jgi:uncharacterized protein YcbK (DUF882 family)